MKAILFSIGTRGDIEPFLALAELLSRKEWDVICVFPEEFREIVVEMGITFKGYKQFIGTPSEKEVLRVMSENNNFVKKVRTLVKSRKLRKKLLKNMRIMHHNLLRKEKPDKILYHLQLTHNVIWGMANPDKAIMISTMPCILHPVNNLSAIGGNFKSNHGKILNKLSFFLANAIKAKATFKFTKLFHNDYINVKFSVSSIKKAMLTKEKTFYMISPTLFPKPNYWPKHVNVVGYYERNKMDRWKPSEKLLNFLEYYDKIIFITFGSMLNSNPSKKTRIILDVLKRNNIPAIINTSWGGIKKIDNIPIHVHFVNNIPYDWVFPKVYAAIHHGGSGTTHTALKNGCPSFIIPHVVDQFYWNNTVAKMKLGPEGMSIHKFNENEFELKLLDLINNRNYKNQAKLIRDKMKDEGSKESLYEAIIN